MTSRHHALIREIYDDWNRGVRDLVPGRQVDDFTIHSRLSDREFRAPDGYRQWVDEIDQQFARWSLEIEQIRDAPDGRVAALGSIVMVGRSSGVELTQETGWVFRFEGEKLAEMWAFASHEEALVEAGLAE